MSSTQKTSVSHRVVCLDRLAQAVRPRADGSIRWDRVVSRHLCLVLFELPRNVQIRLAVAMAERYLPTFERRHPHLTKLREFLARCLTDDPPRECDVAMWASNLSDEDRDDNHAGRALIGAAELAAEAAREGALPMTVTSACVLSVDESIGAIYWEAWEAFDPEAAEVSREDIRRADKDLPDLPYNPLQYRNRRHPEVVSAKLAAWEPVVAWLRAADVGQYPDPVDRGTLAKLVRHMNKPLGTWVLYPPRPDQRPPRPPHRLVCIERLDHALHAWSGSDQHRLWASIVTRRLCLILWGIQQRDQIHFAVDIAERYLPTFERRHPHLTQLRAFLARCRTADPPMVPDDEKSRLTGLLYIKRRHQPDPPTAFEIDTWYRDLSPEDRDDIPTGRLLVAAVRLAAEAAVEGAAPMTITSACVHSVVHAIEVGAWEAWEAIDPEAAEFAREDIRRTDLNLPPLPFNPLRSRNRWHPAVRSAVHAGWEAVVAWLRAADAWHYMGYGDRDTLAKLVRHMNKPIGTVLYPPNPDMVRRDDEP